ASTGSDGTVSGGIFPGSGVAGSAAVPFGGSTGVVGVVVGNGTSTVFGGTAFATGRGAGGVSSVFFSGAGAAGVCSSTRARGRPGRRQFPRPELRRGPTSLRLVVLLTRVGHRPGRHFFRRGDGHRRRADGRGAPDPRPVRDRRRAVDVPRRGAVAPAVERRGR